MLERVINMVYYRTKTYVAGDWTGDSDAIQQLYKWKEGNKWCFHFVDVHDEYNCYDSSKPCTIKDSLAERMSRSKTFVLIVGDDTKTTRKGSCVYQACDNKNFNYYSAQYECKVVGKSYSTTSFIDYECKIAYEAWRRDEMKIVVLYNAASINKSKCPEVLRNIGTHKEMKSYNGYWGRYMYDYDKVRKAIEE